MGKNYAAGGVIKLVSPLLLTLADNKSPALMAFYAVKETGALWYKTFVDKVFAILLLSIIAAFARHAHATACIFNLTKSLKTGYRIQILCRRHPFSY